MAVAENLRFGVTVHRRSVMHACMFLSTPGRRGEGGAGETLADDINNR